MPRARGLRPTRSLVKEAIFNVIRERVEDAVVIELFAGTGALSIEALEHGAASATLVEKSEPNAVLLRRSLERQGLAENARVVKADAVKWIESHPREVGEATLVFLDPPYRDPVLDRALQALDEGLSEGALVVVEHAHGDELPALPNLAVTRAKRYGDTEVTILAK